LTFEHNSIFSNDGHLVWWILFKCNYSRTISAKFLFKII